MIIITLIEEIPPLRRKSLYYTFALIILDHHTLLYIPFCINCNASLISVVYQIKQTISYYFIYGVAVVLQIQSQHSRKNSSPTPLQTPQGPSQRTHPLLPSSKTANLRPTSRRIWSIPLATPFQIVSVCSQVQKLVQTIERLGQTQATCNPNSKRLDKLSEYLAAEALSNYYLMQAKLSQEQKQRVYEAMLTAKERN